MTKEEISQVPVPSKIDIGSWRERAGYKYFLPVPVLTFSIQPNE
ncbi:MAG: hypothetical protein AAB798_02260 [Patescibacteria group bacterium]